MTNAYILALKEAAPSLFIDVPPPIDYTSNNPPIAGHILYDNSFFCLCGHAYSKESSFRTHMKEANFKKNTIDQLVISNKCTVMRMYNNRNQFIRVTLGGDGAVEEKINDDEPAAAEELKTLLFACGKSSNFPDYSEENNIVKTISDDLNRSPFYELSHFLDQPFIDDEVKLKSLLKSVMLTRSRDRSPFDKANSKLSHSFIKAINTASKNHTNGLISLKIQNSDRGFASSLDEVGSGLNEVISRRQNRFRYNFFTPIKTVELYATTIHKLLSMLFYFSNSTLSEQERINVPQLQSMLAEIINLKQRITTLSTDIDNIEYLSSATVQLKELIYKSISSEFNLTDPYSKSVYHQFMFALHLEEINDTIRCGKIGKLTQIAAHILFSFKGVVLLKQVDLDTSGDEGNLIGNPLNWLRCVTSPKLTAFNFVVNFFKIAQTYSQDEKSKLNEMQILRGDDGKLDYKKVKVRDVVINFETFIEGNNKLLKRLYTLVDDLLLDFKIHSDHNKVDGDRYGILKLLKDDYSIEVSYRL